MGKVTLDYWLLLDTPPEYREEKKDTFTVRFNGKEVGEFKNARDAVLFGHLYAEQQAELVRRKHGYRPCWFDDYVDFKIDREDDDQIGN